MSERQGRATIAEASHGPEPSPGWGYGNDSPENGPFEDLRYPSAQYKAPTRAVSSSKASFVLDRRFRPGGPEFINRFFQSGPEMAL